ncbi:hypothetical protein GOP47_0015004 [Adiantum capillus-veneris]|uniref:Uncharacterized protein n=1 Tax=Adiantum capillus-veneris TaxID=13818 RepID=A0A9D4ZFB6_ADICA|nr:hypothetical protein GOP47_0015004 [Adiantum capillus-veneris]
MKEALGVWDSMNDGEREMKGPKDVSLKNVLAEAMDAYMVTKAECIATIQRTIDEGYDAHRQHVLEKDPSEKETFNDEDNNANLSSTPIQWSIGSRPHHDAIIISPTPNIITSSTLVISNGEIHLDSSSSDIGLMQERYEGGSSIQFRSQRSTILFEVDVTLVNAIMDEKASMRTRNIFMM